MHPAFVQGYREVMTKLAEITEEDIAAALTGNKRREITPEEIQAFSKMKGQEGYERHRDAPTTGGIVGGGLGGLLGGGLGYGLGGGKGALIGGGLGLLGGGGLGALSGLSRRSGAERHGKRWGTTLGEIAQEGRVPRHMPYGTHEGLVPHARGIQEQTAQPLTPQEYGDIREGLMKELMTERGLEGALSGAALGGLGGGEDEDTSSRLQSQIAGAALGGGEGTLEGMREARERANTLSDLYERGYGHLAGRLYENQ